MYILQVQLGKTFCWLLCSTFPWKLRRLQLGKLLLLAEDSYGTNTFPPSIHADPWDSLALIAQQFLPLVGDRQLLPCMSPARVTTQGREPEAGLFGIPSVLKASLMEICSVTVSTSRASFTLIQSGTTFLFIPKMKDWAEERILTQSAVTTAKALVQGRRCSLPLLASVVASSSRLKLLQRNKTRIK